MLAEVIELSPRRRWVLKRVVEEYVANPVPVSSELVARRYEADVSSATIRNDLAYLEELGLIMQPHTSAGRVPTNRGYRYYVEQLMDELEPAASEQRRIRHQFHQVEARIDEWVHLATSVLSSALRSAAVVSAPLSTRARVRRIELVQLQEMLVLLALMLYSGGVRQQLVRTEEAMTRDEVADLSLRLNQLLEGLTVNEAQAKLAGAGREAPFIRATVQLLQQSDEQAFSEVYYQGLSYILSQPEFAQAEKLRPIVEVLEKQHLLSQVLARALSARGVHVIIGEEHEIEQLRETAVILTRYGEGDDVVGTLAVVGPTRFPYWRAVPMLRFMGEVMDVLVAEAISPHPA